MTPATSPTLLQLILSAMQMSAGEFALTFTLIQIAIIGAILIMLRRQ